MPRLPLPWSKKRGSRLAASVFTGMVGEVLFFATLFLVGIAGVTATVASRLSVIASAADPFAVEPPGIDYWVFFVSTIILIVAGGFGVSYRILRLGASNERRAAIAQRTGALDLVASKRPTQIQLPNIPQGTDLNDSPGIRLAYRLPSTSSPVIRIAASAFLSLLWVGTWMVLAVVAITGIIYGTPRPMLTFLLLPLGAVGLWTARDFLRQLREAAGVGATIVEISDNPLVPGETYQLYVAQYGRMRLRRFQVSIVCEEETIFRQGTDVRTDRHEVSEVIICNEKNVSIDLGGVWEQEFEFIVPAGAMHSFQSAHNAVHWKIVVTGETRPWPSFSRSFPVVVHPALNVRKASRKIAP